MKIIRVDPPKFRFWFEIGNEATSPLPFQEFVVNCGLLTLPLDIFQLRMCQNDHLSLVSIKLGFHQANYDHDNDQFRVKTKRFSVKDDCSTL